MSWAVVWLVVQYLVAVFGTVMIVAAIIGLIYTALTPSRIVPLDTRKHAPDNQDVHRQ